MIKIELGSLCINSITIHPIVLYLGV